MFESTFKLFTMLPFAYYLLKVIICSAVLFGYYWFFLRNKVFHAYNRFYLLAIVILSVGLPVIKFNIFHETANKTTVVKMLQVVTAGDEYMDEIIIGAPTTSHLNFVDYLPFLYAIISAVFLIMLAQMLVSILILLKTNEKINVENVHFINTDAARGTPFSFFKYIFWNRQIDINSPCGSRIFKHEIAHVQQRHSWDKMFINITLIVFWSNPVFWLIRKELSMIHEFIADKQAVEDGDTAAFAAMILQATYPQKNFYVTNNFFYSPIKRRLMMLTRNQHPRMNYISRLLALPLLVIVFGAFTMKIAEKIDKGYALNKLTKKIIVVLDAGHGGQDLGVTNKNGITEKDLALQLVKKIKTLNKDENIQIILGRENDVFSDPRQKVAFAKSQAPDLFISVHLDNTPKEKWNKVSGMNVFVAKEGIANVEKSKMLGTAILNSFKNNYGLTVATTIFQREKSVYVLQENNFPSVLIEAGYLTNDKDAAYLLSEKGQEAFAKNVLDAIKNYVTTPFFNNLQNQKAKIDSPPVTKIEIKEVENSDKNKALLKNPQITDMSIDLDYKNNDLGLIIINNKIYTKHELNNKLIKGGKAIVYKKGNSELIKKFGPEAANGVIFIENATIETNSSTTKINEYKNSISMTMDSINFVDVNQNKINLENKIKAENYLYVINNKISERKASELILPDNIKSVNVLKGNAAVALYGNKGKNGVLEITTKELVSNQDSSRKIFTQVEVEPEFPGGKIAWRKFLEINLNGSIAIKEGLKAGSYTFITKFIVHEDGSLSDFTSEKNINDKIAKHCIQVIKRSAKWKPAMQNGHIVAAYRKQPITFVVSEENPTPMNISSRFNPVINIGNLSNPRIRVDDLKKQKIITVTNGYKFVNATVYFSGTGFDKVGVTNLKGDNLSTIKEFLNKCDVGTAITFDNISVKNKDGIKFIDGRAFLLY